MSITSTGSLDPEFAKLPENLPFAYEVRKPLLAIVEQIELLEEEVLRHNLSIRQKKDLIENLSAEIASAFKFRELAIAKLHERRKKLISEFKIAMGGAQ